MGTASGSKRAGSSGSSSSSGIELRPSRLACSAVSLAPDWETILGRAPAAAAASRRGSSWSQTSQSCLTNAISSAATVRDHPTDGVAVVDMGSNSWRLVVYGYEPGSSWWRLVDEIREAVRIGAGVGDERMLRPDRIERALHTASVFAGFCRGSGIPAWRRWPRASATPATAGSCWRRSGASRGSTRG